MDSFSEPDSLTAAPLALSSIPGRGQDIVFVIDTTGSMWDDIDSVQAQASAIVDAIFSPERGLENSRIAIVGYNDPDVEVVLSFTNHDTAAERKAAAIDAINALIVDGGGDYPEMTYTGLLTALNGGAGEWRSDAVARKIILFGDAPAKDGHLADEVYALAHDLGADIIVPDGDGTPLPVQIFTVTIGSDADTAAEMEDIAAKTGGTPFAAVDTSEIVDALMEVINVPIYAISASALTIDEGDSGAKTVTITVERDLAGKAATVTLNLGGTAGSDDRSLSALVINFDATETVKTVQLSVTGDTRAEADETVVVSIASVSEASSISKLSATVTILDDDDGSVDDDPVTGSTGGDLLYTPAGGQIIDLGGGADILRGPVTNFFGDKISGFGLDDIILFEGAILSRSQFTISDGGRRIAVDVDGDGTADGNFELVGDFSGGEFMATGLKADTLLTFETYLPELREGRMVDASLVNGINNQAFLTGDGEKDFKITLTDMGFAGYNNTLGVYEIDSHGYIVDARILVTNTNFDPAAEVVITSVEDGHQLGFFLVQNGAAWASGVSGEISFVDGTGDPAHISDAGAIRLAVNGAATDRTVFHSFDKSMNGDGLQHALSGVNPGGESIIIGFEDLTGGGDRDYEDVVFNVEILGSERFA